MTSPTPSPRPSRLAAALRLPRNLLPVHPDKGPWRPNAPQAAFLSLTCKEALYGGAAGGGKSDALLVAALQYVHVPGYSALILRRTYADLALPDAIMDRAKKWLLGKPGVTWNEAKKVFTFATSDPQRPATLTFGFLQSPNDHLRYQGSAYQFVAFDELTQFIEAHYVYLFSRLRKPDDMPVPLRMRAATNPGGPGHDWVAARFNLRPGPDGSMVLPPAGRVFMPAKLSDNPHLDQAAYRESLSELGPIEQARLLGGDWGARPPGEMFDRKDVQWFEPGAHPPLTRIVRRWDFASTEKRRATQDPDFTAGVKMGRAENGDIYILDVKRGRWDPKRTEDTVVATATADGRTVEVKAEKEPGSAGAFVASRFAELLSLDLSVPFEALPSTGSKTERARPFSSYWAAHRVFLPTSTSWTEPFISELEAFPQESVHDDQVDAASSAFADLGGAAAGPSAAIVPARNDTRGSASPYHAERRGLLRGRRP